ncbi:hypothetical protein CCMA1212_002800 [Trichoderma ghanense]|uniref:Uncharacterized protein n=1 Tax=Trichoderma ghanense TaxID=65468 RepID=A0ABY2HBT6_9HYPO
MKGRDKTDVRSTSGFLLYIFLPSFSFLLFFYAPFALSCFILSLGPRQRGAGSQRRPFSLSACMCLNRSGGSAAASCTINLQSTINI